MKAARITAIAAAAVACLTVAACSDQGPPPDFTFVSYAHHPIGGTDSTLTVVDGRVILDVGTSPSKRQFIATFTSEGLANLDVALTQVEEAWDGPYPCEECLYADIYRFEEPSGPVFLMHFSGYALPVIQPLHGFVDELINQVNGCAGGNGPWVDRCFQPIGPDLHPDDWDQPLTPP